MDDRHKKRVTIVPGDKGSGRSPAKWVVSPSSTATKTSEGVSKEGPTFTWRVICQRLLEKGDVPNMEELSIRERLNAADLALLYNVFQHPACFISKFTVSSCGLFDNEADVLLNALQNNKSVTVADLSDNNLTEACAAALISLAQNSKSLTAILLDGNEIFSSTRSIISELLSANVPSPPDLTFLQAAASPSPVNRSLSGSTNTIVSLPHSNSQPNLSQNSTVVASPPSTSQSSTPLNVSQTFAAALRASSSTPSSAGSPLGPISPSSNAGSNVSANNAPSIPTTPASLPSPSSSQSSPGSSRNVSPPKSSSSSKPTSRVNSPPRRKSHTLVTGNSSNALNIETANNNPQSSNNISSTPPFSSHSSSTSLQEKSTSPSGRASTMVAPSNPTGASLTNSSAGTESSASDFSNISLPLNVVSTHSSRATEQLEKDSVHSVVLLMKKEQELKTKLQTMQEQLKKLEDKLAETQSTQSTLQKSIQSLQKIESELKDNINKAEKEEIKIKGKKGSLFNKNKMKIDLRNVYINERIAKAGGSGASVYACTVDGWQCAVKEISLELLDAADSNGFEAEISLLEKLPHHKNIVKYLFHERTANKLRLFMTRYHSNLRDFITTHRPPGPRGFTHNDVRVHALEIIRGLEFLHRHNVLHRDLKADNVFVMLDEKNDIQNLAIGDFNISRHLSHRLTKSIVGTPAWMAPEIFQGHGYSFKADIYSFGMLLFELMTSQRPFYERKGFDVPELVQNGIQPVFPEELPESYSDLIKLHKLCISRKPDERPDAATIKDQLKSTLKAKEKPK